jgi:hypothetical protein
MNFERKNPHPANERGLQTMMLDARPQLAHRMVPPTVSKALPLGSLAAGKLKSNPWSDGYPALQADVEELEALLSFAQAEGRIDLFVARLQGKRAQRDETLNELRLGLHFKSIRYRIVEWEPLGNNGKRGEYSVTHNGVDVIFVEVKSPGWEGELTPQERLAGRTKKPKYIPEERRGGPHALWQQIRACITRAYPKFAPDKRNLLVIADDFRAPPDRPQMDVALYNPNADLGCPEYGLGCFASSTFENLGSVAWIENRLLTSRNYFDDCYRLHCHPNPFALKPFEIPSAK